MGELIDGEEGGASWLKFCCGNVVYIIRVPTVCILPPFGGALGHAVVAGESVPFEVSLRETYYVYMVSCYLLTYCTVFGVLSMLRKTIDVYGCNSEFFFIFKGAIVSPTRLMIVPVCSSIYILLCFSILTIHLGY